MIEYATDNDFRVSDHLGVQMHLRAAAAANTADQHSWSLELALGLLRRCECPRILDPARRDEIRLLLEAARATSLRLLTYTYSEKQIEYGYRAAHRVLDAWTIPPDEGRHGHVNSVCGLVLGMFWFDIINMRRANELAERLRGASLDEVLPPLSTPTPATGAVVPFPGSRHDR